ISSLKTHPATREVIPGPMSTQRRSRGEEHLMKRSLGHLFHRLTGNVAPKTKLPAPKVRPHVEQLEARDQPSVLFPQMNVYSTGKGGGFMGMVDVTHEQGNGLFRPTTFQGEFWDSKFAAGHGVEIPISGGVAFRLFGGNRPAWF